DEVRPFASNVARHTRITIAGEIGENYFGLRLARPAHLEEIDCARTTWSRTRFCKFGPQQGIDYARFANVGPPEKRNFWNRRGGELLNRQGRCHEFCNNPHSSVSGFLPEVASRATSSGRGGAYR